jgi:adenine phosphoribosyltransferase
MVEPQFERRLGVMAADAPFDLAVASELLVRRFPLVDGHPDVAGVLRQPKLLALIGPALAHPFHDQVTMVIAPEARGPILGALVAAELGAGLILARKENSNHPGSDVHVTSAPTWRGEPVSFQARSFDLTASDRVLIVDDWITTGSTIDAIIGVVTEVGALVVGIAALVNKADAETRARLDPHTLVDFDDIGVEM